jgi:inorganic pyrophosphatase
MVAKRTLVFAAVALALALYAAPVQAAAKKSPPSPPAPPPPKAVVPENGGGAASSTAESSTVGTTIAIIVSSGVFGLLFAVYQLYHISLIEVDPSKRAEGYSNIEGGSDTTAKLKLYEVYLAIQEGAKAFLMAEYFLCGIFIVVFGLVVFLLTSCTPAGFNTLTGGCTTIAFVIGAVTSIISGYAGMMVAVYSNARTTIAAEGEGAKGWTDSFNTAFRAGGVMGYSLTSIAMLMLCALIAMLAAILPGELSDMDYAKRLFECVAGYGLGGSCIAMFGRVGGGIYTKAADVGADLAGKVVSGIPEDDPRNPATIADNVGDNVGDVAGMGSDLFGSYAESTCAALVVAASSPEMIAAGWGAMLFPVAVSAFGIFICALTSFLATDLSPVTKEEDVETVLKVQLAVSSILMCGATYPLSLYLLPAEFQIASVTATPLSAWICIASGLIGGCIVGFVTEYYTSHSYSPVREVAQSCETGAATNIIYGLALGYQSAVVPITIIAIVTFISFTAAGMYGVALGALGFLGTLATCLSIDVYGPVCDNAGGIAEMSELPAEVRDKTDALDAAGNTTAAIGKGFAIGSAALVSLALFGGFVTRVGMQVRRHAGRARWRGALRVASARRPLASPRPLTSPALSRPLPCPPARVGVGRERADADHLLHALHGRDAPVLVHGDDDEERGHGRDGHGQGGRAPVRRDPRTPRGHARTRPARPRQVHPDFHRCLPPGARAGAPSTRAPLAALARARARLLHALTALRPPAPPSLPPPPAGDGAAGHARHPLAHPRRLPLRRRGRRRPARRRADFGRAARNLAVKHGRRVGQRQEVRREGLRLHPRQRRARRAAQGLGAAQGRRLRRHRRRPAQGHVWPCDQHCDEADGDHLARLRRLLHVRQQRPRLLQRAVSASDAARRRRRRGRRARAPPDRSASSPSRLLPRARPARATRRRKQVSPPRLASHALCALGPRRPHQCTGRPRLQIGAQSRVSSLSLFTTPQGIVMSSRQLFLV